MDGGTRWRSHQLRTYSFAMASTLWLVMTCGVAEAKRDGKPPRVTPSYFGATFTPVKGMSVAEQEAHFRTMVESGVKQIRVDVPWNEIEPNAPTQGQHHYEWRNIDKLMAALAASRARPSVVISNTPHWAQTNDVVERLQCTDPGIRTRRPVDLNSYAAAAGEVARRYGRGGTFWDGQPFRARPISRYFIWNEANTFPNWCPRPDPVAYAHLVAGASQAIKSHDPRGRVVVGGMPTIAPHRPPAYVEPGDFLADMTASNPNLVSLVDEIGVNVFWFAPDEGPTDKISWFREELRRGGIPDSTRMLVSEAGWPTAGPLGFTETERTRRLRKFTRALPRTNCNVPSMFLHTWITPERNTADSEDWFGVADPLTTALYETGTQYGRSIALFRGKVKKRAPRSAILACPGMPLPDRDGDGVPDEQDRYPLNPARS